MKAFLQIRLRLPPLHIIKYLLPTPILGHKDTIYM